MPKFCAVALAVMVAIGAGASAAGAAGGAASPTKISSCADLQALSNSVESTFANLTGSSGQFKSVAKQLRASLSSVPPGALTLGGTIKPVNMQASIKKLAKLFDQLAGGDLASRAGVIKSQKKVFGKADFDLSDYGVNNCPGLKTA
jgi:hypothetical protein